MFPFRLLILPEIKATIDMMHPDAYTIGLALSPITVREFSFVT